MAAALSGAGKGPVGPLGVAPTGALELGAKARSGDEIRVVLKPAPGRYASLRIDLGGVAFPVEDNEGSGFRVFAFQLHSGGAHRRVDVHFADATAKRPRYRNGAELDGVADGWRLPAEAENLIFAVRLRVAALETGFTRLVFKNNLLTAELPPETNTSYYELLFMPLAAFVGSIPGARFVQKSPKVFLEAPIKNREEAITFLERLVGAMQE